MLTLTTALAVVLMALLPASASAQDISGRASVVDGDTLEVRGVRIRLFGIDAPEGQQLCKRPSGGTWRCGQQSGLALSDKLGSANVHCEERDQDRYGRTVAVCFLGEPDGLLLAKYRHRLAQILTLGCGPWGTSGAIHIL
jgi:endonuclease YncB( thermonuclease family)